MRTFEQMVVFDGEYALKEWCSVVPVRFIRRALIVSIASAISTLTVRKSRALKIFKHDMAVALAMGHVYRVGVQIQDLLG